jgi:conjugal transfer pilus assembly protein TraU
MKGFWCCMGWLVWIMPVFAAQSCHGRVINPITDICWECLFPFTIGGAHVATSTVPDTKNPTEPLCVCHDGVLPRVGVTLGYWEPSRVVEVTPTPFCLVSLGGLALDIPWPLGQGGVTSTVDRFPMSHYQAHWLAYPLLDWVGVMDTGICHDTTNWDLMYLTEFDPSWHDPSLAFLLDPEALLGASLPAQAACAADCVAASTGLPIDSLGWCAGCWGSLTPLSGHVAAHMGGITSSSLVATRLYAALHHRLLVNDHATQKIGKKLCEGKREWFFKKSHYRLQLLYPRAETSLKKGCHPVGRSTVDWSMGDEFPGAGEHFAYVVWQKHNCCAF